MIIACPRCWSESMSCGQQGHAQLKAIGSVLLCGPSCPLFLSSIQTIPRTSRPSFHNIVFMIIIFFFLEAWAQFLFAVSSHCTSLQLHIARPLSIRSITLSFLTRTHCSLDIAAAQYELQGQWRQTGVLILAVSWIRHLLQEKHNFSSHLVFSFWKISTIVLVFASLSYCQDYLVQTHKNIWYSIGS